jgi:hypothetical protein
MKINGIISVHLLKIIKSKKKKKRKRKMIDILNLITNLFKFLFKSYHEEIINLCQKNKILILDVKEFLIGLSNQTINVYGYKIAEDKWCFYLKHTLGYYIVDGSKNRILITNNLESYDSFEKIITKYSLGKKWINWIKNKWFISFHSFQ